ncbi:MAG: TonB-dependent copper receptor [Lysobacteraceae bacterium]
MRTVVPTLLSLTLLIAALPALADDDDARRLDAIVVVDAAPVSPATFVLDPKQPRQPVPASDGADYLKTIPGFNALRSGGSNGDPVLRGLSGSRLNLQVGDGALHGACPARMDNAMSYVAPETYDRVVVVKGPQTVLWGPVGSAGTVRFERQAPSLAEGGAALFDGSMLLGSRGRRDQVIDASIGTDAVYARVSANHAEADDYEDGNGDVVPSRWMKWNADAELGWMPAADTRIALHLGTGDGEARYAGRGMDGAQFDRRSAALRIEHGNPGGPLSHVEVSLFHHHVDHVMDNYTLRTPDPHGSMPMPMVTAVDRRSQGGRAALTWSLSEVEVIAGLDHQDSRHRSRSGMGVDAHLARPWVADASFGQSGVFAEATWVPGAQSRWVGGLRADRVHVRDLRVGTMTVANPTAGQRREDTLPASFLRFERNLAASPAAFHIGIGRTDRFPDYWELFSPANGPMGSVNAFDAIQPERTTQIDIGIDWHAERSSLWAAFYLGRIDDFILFDYRAMHGDGHGHDHGDHGHDHGHGRNNRARNVDARIRGAELGGSRQLDAHWKLSASIAHARGENRDDGQPLPQVAPLEVRIGLNREQGDWSFGTLLRAATAQTRSAPGFGNVVGQDIGDSKGFGVFSINTAYRLADHWRLSAGIDNLFDRAYSEHLNLAGDSGFGYPADPLRINDPGRTLWLKLDWRH